MTGMVLHYDRDGITLWQRWYYTMTGMVLHYDRDGITL